MRLLKKAMKITKKNKEIDPIYPLIIAYLLTIGLSILFEVYTTK